MANVQDSVHRQGHKAQCTARETHSQLALRTRKREDNHDSKEDKITKSISLINAAMDVERMCDSIEAMTALEVSEEVKREFKLACDDLKEATDNRIEYKCYIESQIEQAKAIAQRWNTRAKKMEKVLEALKQDTLSTLLNSPGLIFAGELGRLSAQRNSIPHITMPINIDYDDERLEQYRVDKIVPTINKDRIRADLSSGKEIEGFSLNYGHHVRGW